MTSTGEPIQLNNPQVWVGDREITDLVQSVDINPDPLPVPGISRTCRSNKCNVPSNYLIQGVEHDQGSA